MPGARYGAVMADDGIVVRGVHIPEQVLDWRFSTSGGPGGQHANRNATAAEVRLHLASSPLPERLKSRAFRRLAGQMTKAGEVVVTAADTRSQTRNRDAARSRLTRLLTEATAPPAKSRKPTRPSRRARQRRVDDKRARGEVKRLRQTPDWR